MKLFGRVSVVRRTQGDDANYGSAELFPGDPVTHLIEDHSFAFVIGHTWTISNTKVNQFNFGETGVFSTFRTASTRREPRSMPRSCRRPPVSRNSRRHFMARRARTGRVPIPVFRDDFTYVRGQHAFQIGGTFKPIKDSSTLVGDFNSVTIGLGNPVLSVTGPSQMLADPVASADWSYAYAFALGRIANVSSIYENDHNLQPLPQGSGHTRNYRYYETEAYLQDTWRAKSDLTLTYGLR